MNLDLELTCYTKTMADEEANPPPASGKLPMPRFSGESKSMSEVSIDAELFLKRFAHWAEICQYTDDRKARALGYALTGPAAVWYQQIQRREVIELNNWTDVQREFRTRFVKEISPRFIAAELANLRQKQSETVANFLDRCQLAQTLLDDLWKPQQAENHLDSRRDATKKVHDKMVLLLFIMNLRPELAEKLNLCQKLETLEDHVVAAQHIEKSETDKGGKKSLLPAPIASADAQIEAVKREGGKKKEKSRPPPSYTCRLCGVKGHWISDCAKSDKQQRRLSKQQHAPQRQQQPPPQRTDGQQRGPNWMAPVNSYPAPQYHLPQPQPVVPQPGVPAAYANEQPMQSLHSEGWPSLPVHQDFQ